MSCRISLQTARHSSQIEAFGELPEDDRILTTALPLWQKEQRCSFAE
jgi:hypothetical protein